MEKRTPAAVVFDLGGVLLDWNPRHLYRKIFDGDDERMEWFLANVCTQSWNETFDSGRPFADGVAELVAKHPDFADQIEAYDARWPEMLGGALDETVKIQQELHRSGVPLYALSNWSSEKFPYASRFPFMADFKGLVVSGYEGVKKPEPELFQILIDRYEIVPADALFVDDAQKNIETARKLGFQVHHFTTSENLAEDLANLGLISKNGRQAIVIPS